MGAVHANNFTEALYLVKGPGQLRVESIKYSDDKTEMTYEYWKVSTGLLAKSSPLISFRARPLPGCCGILVLYYVRLRTVDKGEIFAKTIEAAVTAAKQAGYASIIMSLLDSSKDAIGIVTSKGFNSSTPMVNKKTDNAVVTLQLDLKQEKKTETKFVVE